MFTKDLAGIPEVTQSMRSSRNPMTASDGYQALTKHQGTDHSDHINHSGHMASSGVEKVLRGKRKIRRGASTLHGYQTSAQSGNPGLCVDPQMTTRNGDQHLNGWQMPTAEKNTIHLRKERTNPSVEEKLFQGPETPAVCEDTVSMGQKRPACLDEKVCPGRKPLAQVEGSHSPHMGRQTPYVDPSICPPSSFVVESQPLRSSSVSPTVLGELPQEPSDLQIQSRGTKKDPAASRPYLCPYQDCEKSYTNNFQLVQHLRKHTGEKPYACNEPGCPWKFRRPEDLKRHKTKHSGERPHPCAKCNRRFSRLYYLKQHQRVCIQGQAYSGT